MCWHKNCDSLVSAVLAILPGLQRNLTVAILDVEYYRDSAVSNNSWIANLDAEVRGVVAGLHGASEEGPAGGAHLFWRNWIFIRFHFFDLDFLTFVFQTHLASIVTVLPSPFPAHMAFSYLQQTQNKVPLGWKGIIFFLPITSAARDLLAVPSWLSLEQNRDPFAAVLHFQFWVLSNNKCWELPSCGLQGLLIRLLLLLYWLLSEDCLSNQFLLLRGLLRVCVHALGCQDARDLDEGLQVLEAARLMRWRKSQFNDRWSMSHLLLLQLFRSQDTGALSAAFTILDLSQCLIILVGYIESS